MIQANLHPLAGHKASQTYFCSLNRLHRSRRLLIRRKIIRIFKGFATRGDRSIYRSIFRQVRAWRSWGCGSIPLCKDSTSLLIRLIGHVTSTNCSADIIMQPSHYPLRSSLLSGTCSLNLFYPWGSSRFRTWCNSASKCSASLSLRSCSVRSNSWRELRQASSIALSRKPDIVQRTGSRLVNSYKTGDHCSIARLTVASRLQIRLNSLLELRSPQMSISSV